MFSQDYIMRQIQQLTQMLNTILTQVLRIKQHGQEDEAVAYTNEILKEELGFDLEELSSILIKQDIPYLKKETGFTNEHLNILGDIFYELAEDNFDISEKHSQSLSYFALSLQLYEFIEQDEKIYSIDRNLRITKIKDYLS